MKPEPPEEETTPTDYITDTDLGDMNDNVHDEEIVTQDNL